MSVIIIFVKQHSPISSRFSLAIFCSWSLTFLFISRMANILPSNFAFLLLIAFTCSLHSLILASILFRLFFNWSVVRVISCKRPFSASNCVSSISAQSKFCSLILEQTDEASPEYFETIIWNLFWPEKCKQIKKQLIAHGKLFNTWKEKSYITRESLNMVLYFVAGHQSLVYLVSFT